MTKKFRFKLPNSFAKFQNTNVFVTECLGVLKEIALDTVNAAPITGTAYDGSFTVGGKKYSYYITKMDSPYKDGKSFFNVSFDETANPTKNLPTGGAKGNYIKILSTMYKVILRFAKAEAPDYIGLSSLDASGYWNIYNNLTKTNSIPGYSRKDAGLEFTTKTLGSGKFIVLKKN